MLLMLLRVHWLVLELQYIDVDDHLPVWTITGTYVLMLVKLKTLILQLCLQVFLIKSLAIAHRAHIS